LFVPKHLKHLVITQYHLNSGHPGTQRLFTTMKQKYFWPNMFKYEYVSKCVDCQSRNLTKIKTPMGETRIPMYPFQTMGIDCSGPYEQTM
jgi:hypothetical protein